MTHRSKLTKRTIDAATPRDKPFVLWDGAIAGFGIKITPAASRSFIFQYRWPAGRAGRLRRLTIGSYGSITVDTARDKAKALAGKLAHGVDPYAESAATAHHEAMERERKADTLSALAERFVALYARERLRSWGEYERILRVYVAPTLGKRPVSEIGRKDITKLLDSIAGTNGPAMADHVLAIVRKLFNWHAARDESFRSPIVAGMARGGGVSRDRVLTDAEIRAVWAATADNDPMSRLARFLLLTGQRREEAARATLSEIDNATWTVPAARYKTRRPNVVPLSDAARAIVEAMPHAGPFVFSLDGSRPWSSFSAAKRRLDERSGTSGWRVHDLRRTARTLMVRAGVRPDIAERVLGHVIGGVAGVYDRHDYLADKRHALETLAREIDHIVNRPPANVVPLRKAHR